MPPPSRTEAETLVALETELRDVKQILSDLSQGARAAGALEAEIVALRKEKAALEAQLAQKDPVVTSVELASAIKHSLDEMSRTCAVMDNPVSDFAVKEFSLQANVVMKIDSLGQAHYRFLRPGEPVDERALSRINISLVPLPKQTAQGQILAHGGGEIDIEAIDGIGDVYRKTLNQRGIYSIADLLKTGTRVRSRAELAGLLGVDREKLSSWLSQAELMTLKDVGELGAKALRDAGVGALSDLAGRDPNELLRLIQKALDEKTARKLGPLDDARVKAWIEAANAYLGKSPPASPGPYKPTG